MCVRVQHSSRSHLVVQIVVHATTSSNAASSATTDDGPLLATKAKLTLVDLAGSERLARSQVRVWSYGCATDVTNVRLGHWRSSQGDTSDQQIVVVTRRLRCCARAGARVERVIRV
jgi:hypothetical protein